VARCCPAHDDRDPSLSIRDADDGKVLVRCHAGCDQQKVIAALKGRGIWQRTDRQHGTLIRSQPSPAAKDEPDRDDAERTQMALRLWGVSVPATGTLVETYLRSRGIVMPIPATLRFHGGTKHARGKFWPAMVALVTRGAGGAPLAIHRTFLARDGDEPGETAAQDAARCWKRGARRVRIARPPRGFDFNDVLLGRTFGHVQGAA
jgi:putative DNA primase/helicase